MNFLQLCQRVFSEGGISGQIVSVENQTGEALRVVNWVAQANIDIINDQGMTWNFVRKDVAVKLTAGKGTYSFSELNLADGVQWDTRSMRIAMNPDLSDETFVSHMGFAAFRDYWLFSSRRTMQSRPLNASVDGNTHLVVGPIPDQDYMLALQYDGMPSPLIENGDKPFFPERFHMAVVWRALRNYGMFEAAPEVVARADLEFKTVMLQLTIDQAPEVTCGGAIC